MGLEKKTLTPVVTEAIYIKREMGTDDESVIFYFQAADYIAEYNLVISPEEIVENIGKENCLLESFKPNLKFKLKKVQLKDSKYSFLKSLKDFSKYNLHFAFSPQSIGGGSDFAYARMSILKADYLSEVYTSTAA